LRGVEATEIARGFLRGLGAGLPEPGRRIRSVTEEGLSILDRLFGRRSGRGCDLAVEALAGFEEEESIRIGLAEGLRRVREKCAGGG
jgi:hypothetical protein